MRRPQISFPWTSFRTGLAVERFFQALLSFVILGVIYRYCWKDVYDPFKCGALLNQGEWLHPGPTSRLEDRNPFQIWQPPGCMIHRYQKNDIEQCFKKRRLVFIGDSTTRQIYFAVTNKLDRIRAKQERDEHLISKEKHIDIEFISGDVTVRFIWDPYLNSTSLDREIKEFKPYPESVEGDRSAGIVLLGAPGLWFARSDEENYFRQFRDNIEKIIPYMDHEPEGESAPTPVDRFLSRKNSPNLLLLTPVQVPRFEALSPSRQQTITPQKIDPMNDYLQQVSAYSKADVLWSYSLMTFSNSGEYDEDGLHVIEGVAEKKADVLLNLRCNVDAAAQGAYPNDRTCCGNYKQAGGVQLFVLMVGIVILPLFLFVRRYHFTRLIRYLPTFEMLSSLTVLALVLCFCFCTDRTQLFEKSHKQWIKSEFTAPFIVLTIVGLLSVRRSKVSLSITSDKVQPRLVDQGFLSRDQTDEWKGWMQAFILLYHYTHGSEILEIYKVVRVLVASYLFMTGYGHTLYFLRSGDYSLRRFATVLFRLNLLTAALTYMMSTDFLFYYFPALVSFWYLVLYLVLRLGKERNSNLNFLLAKLAFSALLTTALIVIPGLLEFIASVLKYAYGVSWNMVEWRFRLSLDMYIVYIGMMVAVFHHRSTLAKLKIDTTESYIDKVLLLIIANYQIFHTVMIIFAVTFLSGFWVLTRRLPRKEDYNSWHPSISFIPIFCFVLLRNSHRILRNYYSAMFAWLGQISLETYVLQYHVWLAADTKGLLRLGLFSRNVEIAILTPTFIWLSWCTADATRKLTSWIIDGKIPPSRLHSEEDSAAPRSLVQLSPLRHDGLGLLNQGIEGTSPLKVSTGGMIVKVGMLLMQDLRVRLCAIGFLIWFCNVKYS